jgi:hypothetical protein
LVSLSAANPSPVLVTNSGAGQALPVVAQGTTNVAGNLTVAKTTTSPVQVRDVGNPTRHAFQTSLCAHVGSGCAPEPTSFAVPAGQRLVLEYVSGTCGIGSTIQFFIPTLLMTVGGVTTFQPLHAVPVLGPQPGSRFDISQQMRAYADPGTSVAFQYEVIGGDDIVACDVNLSGYLVSM